MTYMFDIWRLLLTNPRFVIWHGAAAKASSWNGLGCARICAAIASACARMDCMRGGLRCERWHEQGGKCGLVASAIPWASGAIAFNSRIHDINRLKTDNPTLMKKKESQDGF